MKGGGRGEEGGGGVQRQSCRVDVAMGVWGCCPPWPSQRLFCTEEPVKPLKLVALGPCMFFPCPKPICTTCCQPPGAGC
eukprot:1160921-Pelagomonas_calceolata.AAC.14